MTEKGFKMPGWFLAQNRAGTSPSSVESGSLLGCGYIVISDYTRYYLVKSPSPFCGFATTWCFFCPNEHPFRGTWVGLTTSLWLRDRRSSLCTIPDLHVLRLPLLSGLHRTGGVNSTVAPASTLLRKASEVQLNIEFPCQIGCKGRKKTNLFSLLLQRFYHGNTNRNLKSSRKYHHP